MLCILKRKLFLEIMCGVSLKIHLGNKEASGESKAEKGRKINEGRQTYADMFRDLVVTLVRDLF